MLVSFLFSIGVFQYYVIFIDDFYMDLFLKFSLYDLSTTYIEFSTIKMQFPTLNKNLHSNTFSTLNKNQYPHTGREKHVKES